jgi:hypothetical protein
MADGIMPVGSKGRESPPMPRKKNTNRPTSKRNPRRTVVRKTKAPASKTKPVYNAGKPDGKPGKPASSKTGVTGNKLNGQTAPASLSPLQVTTEPVRCPGDRGTPVADTSDRAPTGTGLGLVRALIRRGELTAVELDKALKFCGKLLENNKVSARDRNNAAKTVVAASRMAVDAELTMHKAQVAQHGAGAGETEIKVVVTHIAPRMPTPAAPASAPAAPVPDEND